MPHRARSDVPLSSRISRGSAGPTAPSTRCWESSAHSSRASPAAASSDGRTQSSPPAQRHHRLPASPQRHVLVPSRALRTRLSQPHRRPCALRGQPPLPRSSCPSVPPPGCLESPYFTNSLFGKSRLYLPPSSKFSQLPPNHPIPKPLPQCEAFGTAALGFPETKSAGGSFLGWPQQIVVHWGTENKKFILSEFFKSEVQDPEVSGDAFPLKTPGERLPLLPLLILVAPWVPCLVAPLLLSLPPPSQGLLLFLYVSLLRVSYKDTCHQIRALIVPNR